MANLMNYSKKELVQALLGKDGVRSMDIQTDETHKTIAHGEGEKHFRYFSGNGSAIILEIKGE